MTDDKPSAPQTHHEPAAAHAPAAHAPAADHARDMEGLGGHVDEHMSNDHGHGEARLGPIDWSAWGYAVLGIAAGMIVVVAFWLAIA